MSGEAGDSGAEDGAVRAGPSAVEAGRRDCAEGEPLGRQLVFTAKTVRAAFEEMLAGAGGSLATWVVLNAVSDIGFVSQAMLASHVHLEGATMTHHVDRLESLGLVTRQIDARDRRVRRIELTQDGERLHDRLRAAAKEFEQVMNEGLGEADRAALRRMLGRIQSNLASHVASS